MLKSSISRPLSPGLKVKWTIGPNAVHEVKMGNTVRSLKYGLPGMAEAGALWIDLNKQGNYVNTRVNVKQGGDAFMLLVSQSRRGDGKKCHLHGETNFYGKLKGNS